MIGGGQDFPLGSGHVLLPAGDDEDGFFAAHRRLDVRVRLGSKRLDFAT